MTTKNNSPQFTLESLILTDVSFTRVEKIVTPDKQKISHSTDVVVDQSELINDSFAVSLNIKHHIEYDGKNIVSIDVNYSGNFKKIGNATQDELDNFTNINAPAIIFPFVRELIASISTKAMIGTILLQPVNFVQLYKEKKQ
jgi:preprotein translocase subunit SecB